MLGTITLTVEQTEPAKVTLNGEQEENMEVIPTDTALKENTKVDGQAETSEINDLTPESEEKVESPEQSNENQSNEVGFKKVFKFVGFKFTVKKDKTEKSEPVQLLTVKKDEAEVNGTTSQEEHINAAAQCETQQETKDNIQQAESPDEASQAGESPVEVPEEEQKKEELPNMQKNKEEEEPDVEKDKKSPESPTNTVVTETSSPFRRFFTQGWAGLRKKTSFKKSKEEDPLEVEKHIKGEEQENTEVPESVNEEGGAAKETIVEQPVPEESSKSASEELKSLNEEAAQISKEETKEETVPSDQPEDQKPEETVKADEGEGQVTEEKESVPESVTLTVSASGEVKSESDTLEMKPENTQITDELSPPSVEVTTELQPEAAQKTEVPASEQTELYSSTESADLEKGQEAITTEAELLSSQEKVKAQGSPLKKLFSSSGLRKLSGKKSKGKKDDDAKADMTEPAPTSPESPEAAEVDGGDSSPSSPDESAETSPTEKPNVEELQAADLEGEGTTSDGERKKDGITPWASFKKLVTPKRRPKRPSESDKEDEVEKPKTSTMSSTDSGGSAENQEETKESNEEQKLEKSTEENKKKADSSVSWDALICVGSSKKRARKTSDSDEEEIQKSQEECKKIDEETVQTKEPESDSPITSSQEQQVQDSPSPDQASSPMEGDGVSTWQSFKRLVTPRRKSKTKAEEKPEETAVVSNPEQSTSEGEGSKEESWVSFKKLIPGRKKKRSDAKQEQAPPSADQPEHESALEDSDEPAVVPLAEFDAAELEKLNAQKSGPADGSGEQTESPEKPSDELVHAVTVTLIEGERAVTSLEERAPSWISAKVAETIEHAKEVDETATKIKTEITVEETVVLSTVSQVMTETQSTLINEVELTSEALTALEEAIETSCTEETTEMLSAVSQLGESVMSTEQATPVPEDDANVQTQQEQKKMTDNILHAVAESAKLSFNVITSGNAPPTVEDDSRKTTMEQNVTTLNKDMLTELVEGHKATSTIVEEHIEEVIITVTEKVTECISTSLDETMQVKPEGNVKESTLEQSKSVDEDESVTEKPSESVYVPAFDKDTEGASMTAPCGETKVVEEKTIELGIAYNDLSSQITECSIGEETDEPASVSLLAEESKGDAQSAVYSGEELQAEISVPVVSEVEAIESFIVTYERQGNVILAADVKHEEETATISAELQPKDATPMSLEIETAVQDEDGVPVTTEVTVIECADKVEFPWSVEMQAESTHVTTEVQVEDGSLVPAEVQAEKGTTVLSEVKAEESAAVPAEVKAEESDVVSVEVQAEEILQVNAGSPVPPEAQTEVVVAEESDAVPFEVQTEEIATVLAEVKTQDSEKMSCEVQAEESTPLPPKVEAVDVAAPVLSEEQVEEAAPVSSEADNVVVSSEVQNEESAPVSSELENKEAALVPSEVQTEEAAPVSSEVENEETVVVSSEVQDEEDAPVSSEVQAEEAAPVSSEVQAEEAAPVSSEVQDEEAAPVPSGVEDEDVAPVSSELQPEEAAPVSSEVQAEEAAPVSSEVQDEEAAPVPSGVEDEAVAPVSSELQAEEAAPVPSEVQAEEAAPVSSEVQDEEAAPVVAEVQDEEAAPVSSEGQVEDSHLVSSEVQVKEAASVPPEVQAEEGSSLISEVLLQEVAPFPPEMKAGETSTLPSEVQVQEAASVIPKVNPEETASAPAEVQAAEDVIVTAGVQAEEVVHVLTETKTEESFPVLIESHAEGEFEVHAEECVSLVAGENVTEDQAEDCGPVATVVAAEDVPVSEFKAQEGESVPTEECTTLSEVKLEKAAPVLPEEQAEGSFGETTKLQLEVSNTECVEDQSKETISLSDKVDIEDGTTILDNELVDEVVLSKEQDEEHIPGLTEEQLNEDISISIETQANEEVSILAEVQTELPVLAQGNIVEGGTTLAEEKHVEPDQLQTQECVSEVQTEKLESILASAIENVITVVDVHLDSTDAPSELDNAKEQQAPDEEVKQYEDTSDSVTLNIAVNQLSLFEEVPEVKDEIITTNIPEFETSEASNASEPVKAAAVEEKMLAETVKPIETTSDCIQLNEEPDLNFQSDGPAEKSEEPQTLVASVSQKAAAIVDAAIEAATNCFVVDASSQVESTEGTTLTEEKHQTEETIAETKNISFTSTTTVHSTIETTVEKMLNQKEEFVSQVQEPVSVHEHINVLSTSSQTTGNETDEENKQEHVLISSTDLVDHKSSDIPFNVKEETKPSLICSEEDIHKTSIQTDSSTTDTQENAHPVES